MRPIDLRDYQPATLAKASAWHAAGHQRTVIVIPTGSGKSVSIAWSAMQSLQMHDGWVVITAPSRELVRQLSKTLTRYGLAHGYILNGLPFDASCRLFVAASAHCTLASSAVPSARFGSVISSWMTRATASRQRGSLSSRPARTPWSTAGPHA